MITKVVNVNLHQPIYERLTAKQGDIASRYLLFHLLDGDKPFDLTNRTVRVYAIKPDKTEIFNDLTINDASKGYCTLELTSQCLAAAGVVKMELYISQSGKVLTSIPFELEVIACINTVNSVTSTNEFSALEVALGSLQDYYNLRSEIVQARKGYRTVGKRLDNFDSQLDNIKNATKQIYKSTIGVNMWFNIGSSDSYINEVLNDMERLKIKSLLLPCYNVITGNDVDGYSYTKNVSEEQITNVITKAREKGIEDIIIKLHRDGKKDTNSLKWIEMWQTVVNEYIQICKKGCAVCMYVVSVKLNSKKLLSAIAILCVVVAILCVSIPQKSSDVLTSNVSDAGKTTQQHIDFLNAYGYNITEKPIQIQEIIIPQEFSADYEKYNDYQKLSGFDLSKFKGYRAKKYTYKVLDYQGSSDEVVANILIYNNKIIGGDVCSTTLGGFVHGFIKE